MPDEEVIVKVKLVGQRKFHYQAKQSASDVRDIGDETERAGAKAARAGRDHQTLWSRIRSLVNVNKQHGSSWEKVSKSIGEANRQFTFFRNTMRLLSLPGMIAILGLFAQALSTAAAGAVALGSAIAPLGGLVVAGVGIFTAGAQATNLWKFAMEDLMKAFGGNKEAIKRLTPYAKNVFDIFKRDIKPAMQDIRTATQKSLFPGLGKGLKAASKNLKMFVGVGKATGRAIGDLATRGGKMVGSGPWGRDLEKQGMRNVKTIRRLGSSGLNLANAFRHILIAAGPLIDWVTRGILAFSKMASAQAKSGRQSGRLASFFTLVQVAAQSVVNIFKSLWGAMRNIGKAAAPLGREIMMAIEGSAKRFKEWTDSVKGQNTLATYFKRARAPLFEMARLVAALGKMFIRLGSQSGSVTMFKTIRTDMLPVLEKTIGTITKNFGPAFIGMLTNVVKLFGALGGHVGPLTVLAHIIGIMAAGLAFLVNLPVVGHLVSGFLALGSAVAAIKLLGVISGFSKLIGLLKLFTLAAIRARILTAILNIQLMILKIRSIAAAIATKVVAAAQWLWNAAMMANPLTLIIIAVIAVIAIVILLWKKFAWFRNAVKAVWNAIKVAAIWIWNAIKNAIMVRVRAIIAVWRWLWTAAKNVVNWIKTAFSNMVGFFKGLPGKIKTAVGGLWDGVKSGAKAAINFVIDLWNKGFQAINAITPGAIKIGGETIVPKIPDIGMIPHLAAGGNIIRGGVSLVGETGPELLKLPRGAQVSPMVPPARLATPGVSPVFDEGVGNSLIPNLDVNLYVDGELMAAKVVNRISDKKARQ